MIALSDCSRSRSACYPGSTGEIERVGWAIGHRPRTVFRSYAAPPRYASVYLAFGHGHLGLTLGAVTGRLIADLAAERTPIVDMRPYDISRFG
jgi:D-amino-acid dehydrogenase